MEISKFMEIGRFRNIFAKATFVALATYFVCILVVVIIEESQKQFLIKDQITTILNIWTKNISSAFAG